MGLRDVNIELKKMDKSEILKLISEMYKKMPSVKEYLDVYATGNIKELTEKYKLKIEKCIYPYGNEMILRDNEARKLISTIRKMKIVDLNIELELHYVKCCLEIIRDFGYWDEVYYNNIEKMYYSALNGIAEIGKEKIYEKQLITICDDASEYGLELEN
ncbi:MAG: hypothetical protein QM503_06840 [Bacteroidota bacterium]